MDWGVCTAQQVRLGGAQIGRGAGCAHDHDFGLAASCSSNAVRVLSHLMRPVSIEGEL